MQVRSRRPEQPESYTVLDSNLDQLLLAQNDPNWRPYLMVRDAQGMIYRVQKADCAPCAPRLVDVSEEVCVEAARLFHHGSYVAALSAEAQGQYRFGQAADGRILLFRRQP